ncbi:nitrilase family protein [Flavobacterium maritimum]|uniref:nitrilase family protein n=1 Tax=Flavobacterium maritimum TaxID=3149042 RepID=UPI0032B48848
MKVALIQSSIMWENPKLNRKYFEEAINGIVGRVDLVVLPEMFTTGFTMNPEQLAETMQGETIVWLQTLAKVQKCAITGSLIVEEDGGFYNRLLFVFPSGEMQYYDKKHLFTLAGEDRIYSRGSQKIIIEYLGWKICPLVCYDLRFPVFSRNTEDYDLLLYVASWPKPRINAWDVLIRARAVENMCYVIGVNRNGFDNNNLEYVGHSQAVDFLGNYVLEPQEAEDVFIVELSKEKMIEARKKLGFLNDRDSFVLKDL